MHPAELARHGLGLADTTPVRLRGFRRSFCQEPSWRASGSAARGVLTVRPAEGCWLNGLLIHGLDGAAIDALDQRERGYVRTALAFDALEPYDWGAGMGPEQPVAYLGREEKFNTAILPNEEYMGICVAGAARLGAGFLRDFLLSTHLADGGRLMDHRPELAKSIGS